jgi:hypothetical protein
MGGRDQGHHLIAHAQQGRADQIDRQALGDGQAEKAGDHHRRSGEDRGPNANLADQQSRQP